ncbi:OLC1v1004430C1 [Oldenlandia corymbosa var. corymbosa]|uniref:OLC1v1004430C1 n=1 Tax=Oldenlandia corymbosa var. corymbosa TaxID=529605 RepID=A0AAV1DCA3_OLDCO|nr:OLC1v1004430C1 [Oldenlandia corymbosa var. corymbosa]
MASMAINNNIAPDQVPPPVIPISGEEKKMNQITKSKKKSGPFSFFRAALVALKANDDKKKKQKASAKLPTATDANNNNNKEANTNDSNNSDGNWKKIVGSMRPLHLQNDVVVESPPPSLPPSSPTLSLSDHHGIRSFSPSPSHSSSTGSMSQYASASNLQALDDGDEDDDQDVDPDVVFDAICGDELIDSKAEEFIAQFYQQMKIDKHHNSNSNFYRH